MRAGLGIIGWPPSEYWPSTPVELMRAVEGWKKATGAQGPSGSRGEPGDEAIARARKFADTMPDKITVARKERTDA